MSKKPKQKSNNLVVEAISTEREIAEIQLERLKSISRERLLTYEETKIFDILTKNLFLIRGEATTISATSSPVPQLEQISEANLMAIASSIDESIINKSLDTVELEPLTVEGDVSERKSE